MIYPYASGKDQSLLTMDRGKCRINNIANANAKANLYYKLFQRSLYGGFWGVKGTLNYLTELCTILFLIKPSLLFLGHRHTVQSPPFAYRNFYQIWNKNEKLHLTPLKFEMDSSKW